jgi:hypothetical protein
VPVVVAPVLTVHAGLDGTVQAGLNAQVAQKAKLSAGAGYVDPDWTPAYDWTTQHQVETPTLPAAAMDVTAHVGSHLALALYGAPGPEAAVDATLGLEVDPEVETGPEWRLYGGLRVPVHLQTEMLGEHLAPFQETLIDERVLVAEQAYNTPPHTPSNPTPAPDAQPENSGILLRWSGGDADGDLVTYDVYLQADDDTPDTLLCDDSPSARCDPGDLKHGTHYYWRVVATDARGATSEGPVWHFETRSTENE